MEYNGKELVEVLEDVEEEYWYTNKKLSVERMQSKLLG